MIILLTVMIFDNDFDTIAAVIFAIIKRTMPITQCIIVFKPNISCSRLINEFHINFLKKDITLMHDFVNMSVVDLF